MESLDDASVQYNDMLGTVALDWHDGGLHDFAKQCGLDPDKYFPLALTIYPAIDTGLTEWKLGLTFFATEKTVTGSSGTEISAYAQSHNGSIPTKRFGCVVPVRDFFSSAKRLRIVLKSGTFTDVKTIEYDPAHQPESILQPK